MRAFKCLVVAVLALQLSACAEMFEDYTVSSKTAVQSDDGRVYIIEEIRASAWDGSEYVVWTGYNYSGYTVCGQVTGSVRTDGAYNYDGVYAIPPNGSVVLASLGQGSSYYNYNVETRLWPTGYGDRCYAFED